MRFTLFARGLLRPAPRTVVSPRRAPTPKGLGPIGLLISMALAGLLLLLAGTLSTGMGSPESGDRSLSLLVHEYLRTEDPDRASRLLADILQDTRADLRAVETLITEGRSYGMEPIGVQPGLPVRVRDRDYQYGLFVPPSYRPTKDYALVVCLHGAGFTGDAYLERWQSRLGEDYLLACPTLLQGTWWSRRGEDLVLATIHAVRSRYRVDPDRIFLTGMSNGGIGTFLIGVHHAALFAGLSPMAGGLDDVLFPFLENLRNAPVYLIHGLNDQVMPVELSRSVARELTRLGYPVVYREHDRVHSLAGGHFFPREELPGLVAWFGGRRRDPVPKRVTVVRDATHLMAFGWVRIDATDRIAAFTERLIDQQDEAVVNRVYARLDAQIVASNRIEVHTRLVRRYTVFLNQKLVDLAKPVTIVTDGRVSYEGLVVPTVETLLRDARLRQDRRMLFPAMLTIPVEHGS